MSKSEPVIFLNIVHAYYPLQILSTRRGYLFRLCLDAPSNRVVKRRKSPGRLGTLVLMQVCRSLPKYPMISTTCVFVAESGVHTRPDNMKAPHQEKLEKS